MDRVRKKKHEIGCMLPGAENEDQCERSLETSCGISEDFWTMFFTLGEGRVHRNLVSRHDPDCAASKTHCAPRQWSCADQHGCRARLVCAEGERVRGRQCNDFSLKSYKACDARKVTRVTLAAPRPEPSADRRHAALASTLLFRHLGNLVSVGVCGFGGVELGKLLFLPHVNIESSLGTLGGRHWYASTWQQHVAHTGYCS